jgi:S-(hydroxymethyl)glutathione dehydrogenase/alcohol dehydrogenase
MSEGPRFDGRSTRAAVLREYGRPPEIEELEIAEPGPGEVLVRLRASGICHSDLHALRGDWADIFPPVVLGHEGAGTVEAVGAGVERVSPGDAVILSWLPSCGQCAQCLSGRPQLCMAAPETVFANLMPDGTSRLRKGDEPIRSMLTVGSFGEHTVVPEAGAIPIPSGIPFDRAAVVGCAVTTGFGAAFNTAAVEPGQSAVVIGCGGVGLSVVQGCRFRQVSPLIAIDSSGDKAALAKDFGATHAIDASREDPAAAVREIAPDGVDFAFEAIGLGTTVEQALAMLGPGGAAVLVGMPADGVKAQIEPALMAGFEHRVLGCNYGSSDPAVDFPRILDLDRKGDLDLDALITRRISLEQIGEAFAAIERGEGIRSVVIYCAISGWEPPPDDVTIDDAAASYASSRGAIVSSPSM